MGLKNLKVVLNRSSDTYYPGETVSGYVVVELDGTKTCRSINVKAKGEAHVEWDVHHGKTKTTYSAHEEYFNTKYRLYGSAFGDHTEIPSGEHTYPFSFILPSHLPSSFEGKYGYVRYTLKAVIDRPWRFDHEAKLAFTVINTLDLNEEHEASSRVTEEASKTFCCLCCISGPLTLNISLPVRGYVPGQEIPVRVCVENHSGIVINEVKISLRKVVIYHAFQPKSKTRKEHKVITKLGQGPVSANGSIQYEQKLQVPSIPPSHLRNCGIINVEYELKIEACVSGCWRLNLSRSIPIFIGTIPLTSYQLPSYSATIYNEEYLPNPPELGFMYSTSGTAPSAPPETPPSYSNYNLPPPTYEESVFGTQNLRELGDSEYVAGANVPFMPRYPVYNFSSMHMNAL